MSTAAGRLSRARLYLVCGAMPDVRLRAALAGGVDLVQLRMKGATDTEVLNEARRYAALCAEQGVLFFVNDRPDLAVAAGADGVHLGQDDLAVAEARAIVGPDRLIGLSTHTPAQVDAAAADPEVDLTGVGPVYATPTKPGRAAVGLSLIRYAAQAAERPWFAIGGLDAELARRVVAAGAHRIAVVRAVAEAADPGSAARELRAILADAKQEVGVGQP